MLMVEVILYEFIFFCFFFTQSSYWGDHGWKIGDADDHKARTAYESLLRFYLIYLFIAL